MSDSPKPPLSRSQTTPSTKSTEPPRHHYIPQFILKNFRSQEAEAKYAATAGKEDPNKAPATIGRNGKHKKKNQSRNKNKTNKKRNGREAKEDVPVWYYNMETRELEARITQEAYQVRGMHQDASQSDVNYIENALGKLESKAAMVIAKIKKAQEAKQRAVVLLGAEMRLLRRFLYVMQYRTKSQRQRFQCSLGDYAEHDKQRLEEYIRDHGLTSPNDVWLKTLRLLLDVKDTVDHKGYDTLKGTMYEPDYLEFMHNFSNFFVCICEPESMDDEFILSDNSFCVVDGVPIVTGDDDVDANFKRRRLVIDYHRFAPISPRLAIVLRSTNFRVDAGLKAMFSAGWGNRQYGSVFADLPVIPANPTYVNGSGFKRQLSDGSYRALVSDDFKFSMSDSYELGIHSIPTKHVLAFNTIQIDKVNDGLTFVSPKAMVSSLHHYLDTYDPLPFSTTSQLEYDKLALQRSAKAELLRILEESKGATQIKLPPELGDSNGLDIVKEWTKGTNYLKLASGSLDMFASDLKQAQQIETERTRRFAFTMFGISPEMCREIREWENETFKKLDTRVLLLVIRLNQIKDPFKPTSKGWLAPTKAEECIFRLWGKPGVSQEEFNIMLDEALWKEGYRNASQKGLRKKYPSDKAKVLLTLRDCEMYAMNRGGSVLAWAKRTDRYKLFIHIHRLCYDCGISPFDLDDSNPDFAEYRFREFLRRFLFSTENEIFRVLTAGICPEFEDPLAPWKEVLTVWLYPTPDAEWLEARWENEEQGFESMARFFETAKVSGRSESGADCKAYPGDFSRSLHSRAALLGLKARRGEYSDSFPTYHETSEEYIDRIAMNVLSEFFREEFASPDTTSVPSPVAPYFSPPDPNITQSDPLQDDTALLPPSTVSVSNSPERPDLYKRYVGPSSHPAAATKRQPIASPLARTVSIFKTYALYMLYALLAYSFRDLICQLLVQILKSFALLMVLLLERLSTSEKQCHMPQADM